MDELGECSLRGSPRMGSEIDEGLGRDNEVGIGFGTWDNGVGDGVLWVDVFEGLLGAAFAEDLG